MITFWAKFKDTIKNRIPSGIAAPADAAAWQAVNHALAASIPDSHGVGMTFLRGIPSGVVGGVVDAVVLLLANLLYSRLVRTDTVKFADIFFQWIQSTINGIAWQFLVTGGETLGILLGAIFGEVTGGQILGGIALCFIGTLFLTWTTNSIYQRLRGDPGMSAFVSALGAVGFYLDGPTNAFSPIGFRDVVGATIFTGVGIASGVLLEAAARAAYAATYHETPRAGEGASLLAPSV